MNSKTSLALALLCLLLACGSDEDKAAIAPLGIVRLALTEVPADVHCLRVTITGARTVVRDIDVANAGPATIDGLALGPSTLGADAYHVACAEIQASSVPTWTSDRFEAEVTCEPPLEVTFHLRRNGRAHVGFDFDCDCTRDASVAPGQDGGPPLTDAAVPDAGSDAGAVQHTLAFLGADLTSLAIGDVGTRTIEVPVLALDTRPLTRELYIVEPAFGLYRYDTPSSQWVKVADLAPYLAFVDGFDIDFNAAVDRLRIVTSNGGNYRVNPDTGEVITDLSITGATEPVVAIGYGALDSNNSTPLYGILRNGLLVQIGAGSANDGIVRLLGQLPSSGAFALETHADGSAHVVISTPSGPALGDLDLTTGAVTNQRRPTSLLNQDVAALTEWLQPL